MLNDVPKYSTDAIGHMISLMVHKMPVDEAYVNVGVWHGFSLLAGMEKNPDKRVVGVDNFSMLGSPRSEFMERFEKGKSQNHEFYDMSYQAYFKNSHKGKIGLYFYDGAHDYDSQLDALRVAAPFYAPGCLILVDDTNWDAPRDATSKFVKDGRGRYKVIMDKRTETTHPLWWNGLMLLRVEQ